ncbi:MAG TPA: hypothetical protein VJ608_10050 [Albitalea sp.]|nr:hypothetical protein [Albitalea sp.]
MTTPTDPADPIIAAMMRLVLASGADDSAIAKITRALPAVVEGAMQGAQQIDRQAAVLEQLQESIQQAVDQALANSLANLGVTLPSTAPGHVDSRPQARRPRKQKINVLVGGKETSIGVSREVFEKIERVCGNRMEALRQIKAKAAEAPADQTNRSRWVEDQLHHWLDLVVADVGARSAH